MLHLQADKTRRITPPAYATLSKHTAETCSRRTANGHKTYTSNY